MKYFFGENLKYLRNKYGAEQIDVANMTGMKSTSAISEWESGKRIPPIGSIATIAKMFNVSIDDLMHLDMSQEERFYTSTKAIPLVGEIAAGTPILATQNIEDYFNIDSSIRCDFCLKVHGDSMIDEGINNGDIVFIKQQQDVENGEIGAVVIDGEATLKRIYKRDNTLILQPANIKYEPIVIDHGDIMIAGKLVAVLNMR